MYRRRRRGSIHYRRRSGSIHHRRRSGSIQSSIEIIVSTPQRLRMRCCGLRCDACATLCDSGTMYVTPQSYINAVVVYLASREQNIRTQNTTPKTKYEQTVTTLRSYGSSAPIVETPIVFVSIKDRDFRCHGKFDGHDVERKNDCSPRGRHRYTPTRPCFRILRAVLIWFIDRR